MRSLNSGVMGCGVGSEGRNMDWIITAIIAAALFWFFFFRSGNLSFWQLAAKYPDEAYQHFLKDGCWFVGDVPADINKDDVVGPFKLIVPKLGRSIFIYGLANQINKSQDEFIRSKK